MKNLLLPLVLLIFINANAQQRKLYILTNKMYDKDYTNSNVFNNEIFNKISSLLTELQLSDLFIPEVIDDRDFNSEDCFIKMYSAYNYLSSPQKNFIIPQVIVNKRNWQAPYYYSYFIARKQPSRFNSFNDFSEIKRIYLQRNSMSGYYAPLYKLWEIGFIKNPSIQSLEEERGKEVKLFNTSDSVIHSVNKDEYSIGATGEELYGNLNVEIKLVNMVLPQDVICISQNLASYEDKLNTLIYKVFNDSAFIRKSHLLITQVQPFSQTYINSYNINENIITIVNSVKDSYNKDIYLKRVIPLDSKISFIDILSFIRKSGTSVYLGIFSILVVVYIFGHNTGKYLLPFFSKIKNLFKYNPKD